MSSKEVRLTSARTPSVTWIAENLCRQIISLIAFLAEQQLSEVNPWFTDEINCTTGVIVSRCTAALKQKQYLQFDPRRWHWKRIQPHHLSCPLLCDSLRSSALQASPLSGDAHPNWWSVITKIYIVYNILNHFWHKKVLPEWGHNEEWGHSLIFKAEVKCKGKSNRLHAPW